MRGLTRRQATTLIDDWRFWAREDQLPPPGAWRTWLVLGGRGAGKTRTGAEWLRAQMSASARGALIGPTFADVREVMIEGPSGLRSIGPAERRPTYEAARRRLVWPNGALAYAFSAEDPDALRGPQFSCAWGDEVAAWAEPEASLAMLDFALRLGPRPRRVLTTTPKPIPALKRLIGADDVVVSRAATRANAAWLSDGFLGAIEAAYAGTRLGRQELDGELVETVEGALWPDAVLAEVFDPEPPPSFERVVVGVDPPAGEGPTADACGIVVAGAIGSAALARAWVLADRTVQGLAPAGWAGAVVAAARAFDADRVVVEVNQGGAMVEAVLRAVDAGLPVKSVRASRGKHARAEPIAALYERGRVKHAGRFPALIDEMARLSWATPGPSPDRVDALVWALSELLLGAAAPRLRAL